MNDAHVDPRNGISVLVSVYRVCVKFLQSALRANVVLPMLLVLCVGRLWLMPLPSSFWTDEIVTAFVIREGPNHPSLAAAPQVTKSIYYGLPRGAAALLGSSEVSYRLPSLLAMGIALFLIARLAARLIHPQAAWFAAFACLALRGINYEAVDARPYALGTCIAAGSMFFLVRWLDTARWRDALLFAFFAALLWRVHLVFWPIYIVFILYTVVRMARDQTRVSWVAAGCTFVLLAVALAPVALDAAGLLREARAHTMGPPPTLGALGHSLKYEFVVGCVVGAWLLSAVHIFRSRSRGTGIASVYRQHSSLRRWLPRSPDAAWPSGSSFALTFGWWLCPPIGLFIFSHLTGGSVLVARYLSIALPGAALTATVTAGLFVAPAHWKRLSIVLGTIALLIFGQWGLMWPQHDKADWRAATYKINELALAPDTPIICPSPFVEARAPVWRPDYTLPGFLYAHLLIYPISGKPYLFPYEDSAEAEQYATQVCQETLPASGRFLIYGARRIAFLWRDWFARRPELAGWSQTRLGPFGDIEVVMFEKEVVAESRR
jgi:hypothetical protein